MPSAEIITIGTEILLGEIVDTNAAYLARILRSVGINLFRKTTVGDNPSRIAQAIQEGLARAEIILTTGGLGPTVDDPTRDGVALAFGVPTEFRSDLWAQVQERFQRYGRQPTENNRRQAYLPRGAVAIENPVGTAPAFYFETGQKTVISLPGVPREMEYLTEEVIVPYLRQRYNLTGIIKTRTLHTAGVGESQIDDLIGDLETLTNPTVGLAAHSGQVDVRIAVKADSEAEADALISPVEEDLRRRLSDWVYGADEDTLEEVAIRSVADKGWSLVVVEAGLNGNLTRRLSSTQGHFLGGEVLTHTPTPAELLAHLQDFLTRKNAQVGLGVIIQRGVARQEVYFLLVTPEKKLEFLRPYGGPPDYAPRWALHHSLDIIRKEIQ